MLSGVCSSPSMAVRMPSRAKTLEQFAQGLVAEEVHPLIGDLEASVLVAVAQLTLALLWLLGVDEVLLLHLLNDLVDEFFDLVFRERVVFFLRLLIDDLAGLERLADGIA